MTDIEKTAILKQYERMICSHVNRINRHKFLSLEAVEELENDMRMKVWQSLDNYDSTKAGLSTWIHKALNLKGATFLYHYFKDTVKTVDNNSIVFTDIENEDDREGFTPEYNDNLSGFSFRMILESIPDGTDRNIIYRWCSGWTMRDIAEADGCTWQNIQRRINRTVKWLRENMEQVS